MTVGPSGDLVFIAQRDASSALEQFAYIVSHDVRNSARALAEIPHWIIEDLEAEGVRLNSDMRDNLSMLDKHARRLDRMLTDLLSYSRAGRTQKTAQLSVTALVRAALDSIGDPPHLTVTVDEGVPDLRIGVEDAKILFDCVVSNTARHGAPRNGELKISGERSGDLVTLRFDDNGPGVPPQDLEKIFQPMTTLRRRDEVEGSGMGLAILQKLVGRYDGRIWASSANRLGGLSVQVELHDAAQVDFPGPVRAGKVFGFGNEEQGHAKSIRTQG
ncbi:hypothetical protein E4Z66_04390 [Aliishimia ponticola]|uniref:histidine kinase n=1 Tax=Aliishimia ponticola TaxID=2499833 RepID=A0A4S4NGM4_9RHOB|nr:ATP-binding protein [Aliishimia ponticola]THH38804.1 hypothetical protein E4Z66_04390 [Aliishimia ponticola]